MSKESKQEQLRKRLDSLFSEMVMEQGADIPAMSSHTSNTGWMWRCDSDGIYVDCSPEVHAILDYKPDEVIGNPLREFALEPISRGAIDKVVLANEFPVELPLQFRTKLGAVVNISFHIFKDEPENGKNGGMRGFAQIQRIIEAEADAQVAPPEEIMPEEALRTEVMSTIKPVSLESTPMAYQETASLDPAVVLGYLAGKDGEKVAPTPILMEPTKLELLEIIDSDPDREWSDDELLLVEQVADQLSLALENAKLFNQTQDALSETDEQARRLRLLNEMSEELSRVSALQEILDITSRFVDVIMETDRSNVTILTDSGEALDIFELHGEKGAISIGTQLPLEGTAAGMAIKEGRLINIGDLEKDIHNIDSKTLFEEGIRATLVAPLFISGKVLGTLNIGSHQINFFSKNEENLITSISTIVSSTVENRRLFDAVQGALLDSDEQGRRLKLLNEMSEQLSQVNDIDEIGRIVTAKTLEILQSDRAIMMRINNEDKTVEVITASGSKADTRALGRMDLEGPLAVVVNEKRLVVNEGIGGEGALSAIRSTMIAPIISEGEVICTLNVDMDHDYLFTSGDQDIINQIASLLSGTLENNRLISQIQRRSAQLNSTAEVSTLAGGILDSADLLQQVIEAIREGFNLYYAGLFLVDKDGDWTGEAGKWAVLQGGTGEPGRQMLAAGHKLELGGESMIGSAIADGKARIALDVGEEAVFFRNPYLPDTRSEMALPLIARGVTLGALTIQSIQEAAFTQEDITALQTMADQVANSIDNVNLFEQTQERAEELSVLNEMARAFTQTLESDTIIENIHVYTSRLMDARNFFVALYDKEIDEIYFPLFKYRGGLHEGQGLRRKSGSGLTEWIINNRKPLLLSENAKDWIQEQNLVSQGRDAHSWLGVPMLRGGEVMGVIAVQSYSTNRRYTTRHLDLLSAVANQAGTAIENANLFQETQERARTEQERATQERLVRTITEKVRSGHDTQSILQIAVEELGKAIGAKKSIGKLGTREQLIEVEAEADTNQTTDPPPAA
jgi:GAF domain-containing protein